MRLPFFVRHFHNVHQFVNVTLCQLPGKRAFCADFVTVIEFPFTEPFTDSHVPKFTGLNAPFACKQVQHIPLNKLVTAARSGNYSLSRAAAVFPSFGTGLIAATMVCQQAMAAS